MCHYWCRRKKISILWVIMTQRYLWPERNRNMVQMDIWMNMSERGKERQWKWKRKRVVCRPTLDVFTRRGSVTKGGLRSSRGCCRFTSTPSSSPFFPSVSFNCFISVYTCTCVRIHKQIYFRFNPTTTLKCWSATSANKTKYRWEVPNVLRFMYQTLFIPFTKRSLFSIQYSKNIG